MKVKLQPKASKEIRKAKAKTISTEYPLRIPKPPHMLMVQMYLQTPTQMASPPASKPARINMEPNTTSTKQKDGQKKPYDSHKKKTNGVRKNI